MVGYDPKRDVELSKTEQGAAGALSGILTRTLIQPLDVLKIRFQLQIEPIRRGSLQSKYQSILQATRKIVTEEGVKALWKGHMPAQVLSVTYGGVQFVSFEFFTKEVWNELPSTLTTDYRPITHFMCGGLAGCISTLFCQPADVVRTRLIGQGEPKFYKTSWHAFSTLYAKEGFLAFYKGLLPAILTVFPQAALQFGFYTFFGQLLTSKNASEISAMDSMTCGFCAGTCSKAVVYPLDVLKKRLQVQGFEEARKTFGEHRIYNGLCHCIKLIWKEEKLGGFYKGITPSLLKAGLSTGFSFFFYEQSCYLMRKRYRNDLDKYR
ncbi:mitochondrial thiamine pyrophosphate carrier [Lingula anatina]|uniref:Mitochondrial thiamine pyrophosphate carrier n=1 Tax=Lingula anatina TaxID=7574 RepID=A0A1S3IIQ5_LINAN|nr:mitochondrial thiamine pyrophosphate carrier [Lingula anatina]|eukprot:XP_013398092.1 mitochondrial thiamine pyrophosphate carrier [Lingula anatina]